MKQFYTFLISLFFLFFIKTTIYATHSNAIKMPKECWREIIYFCPLCSLFSLDLTSRVFYEINEARYPKSLSLSNFNKQAFFIFFMNHFASYYNGNNRRMDNYFKRLLIKKPISILDQFFMDKELFLEEQEDFTGSFNPIRFFKGLDGFPTNSLFLEDIFIEFLMILGCYVPLFLIRHSGWGVHLTKDTVITNNDYIPYTFSIWIEINPLNVNEGVSDNLYMDSLYFNIRFKKSCQCEVSCRHHGLHVLRDYPYFKYELKFPKYKNNAYFNLFEKISMYPDLYNTINLLSGIDELSVVGRMYQLDGMFLGLFKKLWHHFGTDKLSTELLCFSDDFISYASNGFSKDDFVFKTLKKINYQTLGLFFYQPSNNRIIDVVSRIRKYNRIRLNRLEKKLVLVQSFFRVRSATGILESRRSFLDVWDEKRYRQQQFLLQQVQQRMFFLEEEHRMRIEIAEEEARERIETLIHARRNILYLFLPFFNFLPGCR